MRTTSCLIGVMILCSGVARAADVKVTDVKAAHRNGQTFVTWKDAADGEAGQDFRYSIYRSDQPITQATLGDAELVLRGVFNNSAKLFGHAFWPKDRLDPKKPTCIIVEGGKPLPAWSGLAVRTVEKDGRSYYAVVATDLKGAALSKVVPGESATTEPVAEKVAPIQPIKLYDSNQRKSYVAQTRISGKKGLPLSVQLHASSGRGGTASGWGDYYLYFSRREWGYRDGLPGVFSVQERSHGKPDQRLIFDSREAIVTPSGTRAMETYWFGYVCVPQWAEHKEPRAYPFTERRTLWMIRWTIEKYGADPERVYCGGGSMGAWGTSTFALRHPELFAAVYPNRPRTRQRGRPGLVRIPRNQKVMMDDGKTDYFERMDMVKFVSEHHGDLPFLGWCCGRHDGFASFKEQIDMVKALTKAHHGFAFAWNDGNHSSGGRPMREVTKYYPWTKFARNKSYPAFGNSSIDGDLGTGEVEKIVNGRKRRVLEKGNGDLEGGINLGFDWADVVDEADKWSVALCNVLTEKEMTVDVTPRRCQMFGPKPGDKFKWTNSAGGTGEVAADRWGLVTVEKVKLVPCEKKPTADPKKNPEIAKKWTTLTIERVK